LSSDPEQVDHEIALLHGRMSEDGAPLIQQISLRVETLDDLRTFRNRMLAEGYKIDRLVTHLSAIGGYFSIPKAIAPRSSGSPAGPHG
jgi:hypothetical protein